MSSVIKSICDLIIALTITGGIGFYGIQSIGEWIKKEALTKVHQGLPSLSQMTESMTCKKFDNKMKLVKSFNKHCRGIK